MTKVNGALLSCAVLLFERVVHQGHIPCHRIMTPGCAISNSDGSGRMQRVGFVPTQRAFFRPVQINGYYSRSNIDYGGLSPRDYLRGRSWDEQMQEGLKILRDKGVLQ